MTSEFFFSYYKYLSRRCDDVPNNFEKQTNKRFVCQKTLSFIILITEVLFPIDGVL